MILMRRLCDAHDIFIDCVTHTVMFLMQRFLWALMESIWRICNARGFLKLCDTHCVRFYESDGAQLFILPDAFLMLDVFYGFRLCR